MTQRVFDIENEKDMADLWDILPDDVSYAKKTNDGATFYSSDGVRLYYSCELININWHGKYKITRPIQEATKADIGKLCRFSLSERTRCSMSLIEEHDMFGILTEINNNGAHTLYLKDGDIWFNHCRRLTKQEIEGLC